MNKKIATVLLCGVFFLGGCSEHNSPKTEEIVQATQTGSSQVEYSEHTKTKLLQVNNANNIELLVNEEPLVVVNPYIQVPHYYDETHPDNHPLGKKTYDYVKELLSVAKYISIDYSHEDQQSDNGERYAFLQVEGNDLGELLLKQGLAKTINKKYETERFHRYKTIEKNSENEELGIWLYPGTFDEEGFK